VSVPSAAGASPAATAAAEPDDEPPGTRDVSHGFFVGQNALFSPDPPIANSSKLVFQKDTNHRFFRRSVTVDSYGGTKFSSIFELAVVRTPASQNKSFIAIGSHFASTFSVGSVLNAFSSGLYRFARARK
jgi:hypothetical protein